MFTMACTVGRLCELRFGEEFDTSEMIKLRTRMADMFAAQPGKLVFCTDLRALERFDQQTESALVGLMRADNPRVGRSGFLVPKGGTFALQVLRMVQNTESRVRRVFGERAELEAWLGMELTEAERQRLRQFLDG